MEPRMTSRRESAKQGRRTRIVEAAAELLREVGVAEMSVKMIADLADVSPATVYNLFGTKAAVMENVYQLGLLHFERLMSRMHSKDAIERVFDSVTITADQFRADPKFHRAMIGRTDHGGDSALTLSTRRLRAAYWCAILREAIQENLLQPSANPDLLSVMMIQISSGALSHWATYLISVDQLEREIKYGLATLLWPSATPAVRTRLEIRMRALEQELDGRADSHAGRTTSKVHSEPV